MAEDATGALPESGGPITLAEARERYATRPETNSEQATESGAAQQGSGDKPDAAVPEGEPRGETEGQGDAAQPPIPAPRSWTKEEKEAFAALPREHQERIAHRERERQAEIDRRLNEADRASKAAEAREQAAQQARQQYEAALPGVLNALQSQMAQEFPDVKSWDDVARLAQENPVRYLQLDALIKRSDAVAREARQAQEQQQAQQVQQFNTWAEAEVEAFLQKAPEFADPAKAPALREEAAATLKAAGYSDEEIGHMWAGRLQLSARDHRMQLLVRDAMRYRMAQRDAAKAKAAPAQTVQKPGVATTSREQKAGVLGDLHQRLEKSGKVSDAMAILRARRAG